MSIYGEGLALNARGEAVMPPERSLEGNTTTIVEVRTDREQNLSLHRRVAEAVSAALSPPGPAAAPEA